MLIQVPSDHITSLYLSTECNSLCHLVNLSVGKPEETGSGLLIGYVLFPSSLDPLLQCPVLSVDIPIKVAYTNS